MKRGPIVLPLTAYYGGEADQMARRARFYALAAKVFGFGGWRLARREVELAAELGYGGRGRELAVIDRKQATSINTAAAPLEWLTAKGRLETKRDEPGHGLVRFSIALRFREEVEGAGAAGVKAQDLGEGGGGGFGSRSPSDYAIDCATRVKAVEQSMTGYRYDLLFGVLINDDWPWERRRTEKAQREVILDLHRAIDRAGVELHYLTMEEYRARWINRPKPAAKKPAARQPRR